MPREILFSHDQMSALDMLPGLQQGQEKMSKSDPSSSIYTEDEEVCTLFETFL